MTPLAKAHSPLAFLLVYVRARPWHFGVLVGLVIGAGACAVAVQYSMITERLRIIGQHYDLQDRVDAVPVAPRHGLIEFRDVSIGHFNVSWKEGRLSLSPIAYPRLTDSTVSLC